VDVSRAVDQRRLAGWLILVSALIFLGYGSRAAAGKPDQDVAYRYSTAVSGLVQYAVILGVVLAITKPEWVLLALRRPRGPVVSSVVIAFVAIYAASFLVNLYSNPGKEQGLTPNGWDSSRAVPFVVNFVVFAAVAPVVEELTFRGLGFSVLEPFGTVIACVGVGLAFGLAHGLIEGLPVLVVFGTALAWVRSRTDSVYPGMGVHAVFNSVALIVSVTGHG
jgi:membrane protease YdiL (CAAX protease family)